MVKDRHSRSGLHQSSELQRKNGAGAHNWGSFRQEGELELAANADARLETDADAAADDVFDIERDEAMPLPRMNKQPKGNMMNQDGMMMDNQDLAKEVISTSPSESMSSLHSAEGQARGNNVAAQGHPQGQRSTSNISDAEREQARIYREGVMNKGGEFWHSLTVTIGLGC